MKFSPFWGLAQKKDNICISAPSSAVSEPVVEGSSEPAGKLSFPQSAWENTEPWNLSFPKQVGTVKMKRHQGRNGDVFLLESDGERHTAPSQRPFILCLKPFHLWDFLPVPPHAEFPRSGIL